MDINFVRAMLTLLLFIGFVSMIVLIIIRGNTFYDEAANLPFVENDNDKDYRNHREEKR